MTVELGSPVKLLQCAFVHRDPLQAEGWTPVAHSAAPDLQQEPPRAASVQSACAMVAGLVQFETCSLLQVTCGFHPSPSATHTVSESPEPPRSVPSPCWGCPSAARPLSKKTWTPTAGGTRPPGAPVSK